LVSQSNWAPRRHYTQAASIESASLRWEVRRSAGPPLARGPIRRNRSNRLKTGPVQEYFSWQTKSRICDGNNSISD